jgi:hypothetical protein
VVIRSDESRGAVELMWHEPGRRIRIAGRAKRATDELQARYTSGVRQTCAHRVLDSVVRARYTRAAFHFYKATGFDTGVLGP